MPPQGSPPSRCSWGYSPSLFPELGRNVEVPSTHTFSQRCQQSGDVFVPCFCEPPTDIIAWFPRLGWVRGSGWILQAHPALPGSLHNQPQNRPGNSAPQVAKHHAHPSHFSCLSYLLANLISALVPANKPPPPPGLWKAAQLILFTIFWRRSEWEGSFRF